jgi:aldehyde dehydrogenase (NAD+)
MEDSTQHAALVARQREWFERGATRDLGFRDAALAALGRAVVRFEPRILEALRADLRKSEFEAQMTEIGLVLGEIRHARRNLRRWAKPRRVGTPLALWPGRCRVHPSPRGVCLIIAPWNYPFQLALAPLVSALAAGDCAVVKPSELAPATSEIVAALIADAFPAEHVAAVQGGVEASAALLGLGFDLIFFTGSAAVGRAVMRAAAERLTPVVLELGGKSPCVIDSTADLEVTARRVAFGKLLNAGQTCVAPDYALVQAEVHDAFVAALRRAVTEMYGARPQESPDYARIVNRRHFDRVSRLLSGAEIAFGGETDAADLYVAPTALVRVAGDAPCMQEEIFGPILPVLPYGDADEAIRFVNARPAPLALYAFTRDRRLADRLLGEIAFGGGCVNDTIMHLANPDLPFGGVGQSGLGACHGRAGFDAFSHEKSIVHRPFALDFRLRYAPATATKMRWLRRLSG